MELYRGSDSNEFNAIKRSILESAQQYVSAVSKRRAAELNDSIESSVQAFLQDFESDSIRDAANLLDIYFRVLHQSALLGKDIAANHDDLLSSTDNQTISNLLVSLFESQGFKLKQEDYPFLTNDYRGQSAFIELNHETKQALEGLKLFLSGLGAIAREHKSRRNLLSFMAFNEFLSSGNIQEKYQMLKAIQIPLGQFSMWLKVRFDKHFPSLSIDRDSLKNVISAIPDMFATAMIAAERAIPAGLTLMDVKKDVDERMAYREAEDRITNPSKYSN